MFPERLISARKMAGLSLEQLANRIGNISRQALNNYEKGKRKPDSSIIIALSNALNVKPDYFFQEKVIPKIIFDFRKKSALLHREEERIEETAKKMYADYLEIESILGIENRWTNPIESLSINNANDVEKAAILLRENWALGEAPICSLTEVVETHGIKLLSFPANESFDGMACKESTNPIILINNNMKDACRIRFTIAHELGHILLKFNPALQEHEKEILCHYFAGALLLPLKQIETGFMMFHSGRIIFQELFKFKELYGISIQAIAKRLHSLDKINDFEYQKFNAILNKKGWRKNEPGVFAFEEKSGRFDLLVYKAVEVGIISMSKAATILNIALEELKPKIEIAI